MRTIYPGVGDLARARRYDVQSAGDNTTFKYKSPVRREVVYADTQGQQMVVRWVTDNAGPWFGSYTGTFVYRMCNPS